MFCTVIFHIVTYESHRNKNSVCKYCMFLSLNLIMGFCAFILKNINHYNLPGPGMDLAMA